MKTPAPYSTNIGFTVSPWPWKLVQLGKPVSPVFYIRDSHNNEVVRLDGPNARERAELLMDLAAQNQIHYHEKHGLPAKQLV